MKCTKLVKRREELIDREWEKDVECKWKSAYIRYTTSKGISQQKKVLENDRIFEMSGKGLENKHFKWHTIL